MFDFLKDTLINKEEKYIDDEKRAQISTCALFLEIANSDDDFADVEKKQIFLAMKNFFNLNTEEIEELMQMSEKRINTSVSVFEFTEIIKQHFNNDQIYDIIKKLWELVYSDGKLDRYEDYIMRKISGNLMFPHKMLMTAKAEAKRNYEKKNPGR